MPRIRTIKPELFKHSGLFDAEKSYGLPLRIAFVGLFCVCDRKGRFKWRPRELKLDILPYDDLDFSLVLDAFLDEGFIGKYVVNGNEYGYIPSWHNHQVINNRESESNLPCPQSTDSKVIPYSRIVDACPTRDARVPDALSTPLCSAQVEGKGREGKGKDIREVETSPIALNDQSNTGTEGNDLMSRSIVEVFEYWKQILQHPKAKLDRKRKQKIAAALKQEFTISQLKQAIDGCSKSQFHMGQNAQGKRYDGIDLIFRDAGHIEQFIDCALGNPGSDGLTVDSEYKKVSEALKKTDELFPGGV